MCGCLPAAGAVRRSRCPPLCPSGRPWGRTQWSAGESEASAEGEASAEPAPEFGYIVDYRESDGMYRIVFDDIKDAEDANYWYKRDVDWYKRGVDFEVL